MHRLPLALTLAIPSACLLAQTPPPQSWVDQIADADPGDIIDLGTFSIGSFGNPLNANPNRLQDSGGRLLYSDDPETAEETGILYRDDVPAGDTRVYLYHVNGMSTGKRFSILVENRGASVATITPLKRSFPAPSGNYLAVGREGSRLFYESVSLPPSLSLDPGTVTILDPELDSRNVNPNALLATIHDFRSDVPIRVAAVMIDAGADTLAVYTNLDFAANDGHNRQGTFPAFTRNRETPYAYNTVNGVKRLRIADGSPLNVDPPIAGTNAETSVATTLPGNYGVTYEIDVAISNPGGRRLAILLNPRGGNYAGYVRTRIGPAEFEGVTASVIVSAPTTPSSKGALVASFLPSATVTDLRLEFIPAGASSLPIEFLLVPFDSDEEDEHWRLF